MGIAFEAPESIAERVTDYLKKQLLVGEKFPPGSFIREADVASELGISRSPVREALKELAGHGLVRMIPRKGALVPQYNEGDIRDIYGVRTALDMLVYEHIVARHLLTDCHEQWLRERVALLGQIALSKEEDSEDARIRFLELDGGFHFYIHGISGLEWTAELLRKTYSRISQIRYHHIAGIDLMFFVDQHLAIVENLRSGDLAALRTISEESARKGPEAYLESKGACRDKML